MDCVMNLLRYQNRYCNDNAFACQFAVAIEFNVAPSGVVIIPVKEMLNETFHCNVIWGNHFGVSTLNGTVRSTQGTRDIAALNQRGMTFSFSDKLATICMPC